MGGLQESFLLYGAAEALELLAKKSELTLLFLACKV